MRPTEYLSYLNKELQTLRPIRFYFRGDLSPRPLPVNRPSVYRETTTGVYHLLRRPRGLSSDRVESPGNIPVFRVRVPETGTLDSWRGLKDGGSGPINRTLNAYDPRVFVGL